MESGVEKGGMERRWKGGGKEVEKRGMERVEESRRVREKGEWREGGGRKGEWRGGGKGVEKGEVEKRRKRVVWGRGK